MKVQIRENLLYHGLVEDKSLSSIENVSKTDTLPSVRKFHHLFILNHLYLTPYLIKYYS